MIKVFGDLKNIIGESGCEINIVPGSTVYDALNNLIQSYPVLEKKIFDNRRRLSRYINIFINGHNIKTMKSLGTALKENDRIVLVPPFGGG